MIELRWIERIVKMPLEGIVHRDGSPVMEDAVERVLQWREEQILPTGEKLYEFRYRWSDWRDVPTVRE